MKDAINNLASIGVESGYLRFAFLLEHAVGRTVLSNADSFSLIILAGGELGASSAILVRWSSVHD